MEMETVTVAQQAGGGLVLNHILLLISVSGFFGGFVSAIFELIKDTKGKIHSEFFVNCTAKDCLPFILDQSVNFIGKALIGVGGAFGIILLGLWFEKISLTNTVQNQLLLISLCVVTGTFSFRFLPRLGVKVEEHFWAEKLSATEKKLEETVTRKTQTAMNFSTVIAHAETALSREAYSSDVPQAIQRMEEVKDQYYENQTFNILLGRLYKKNKDYVMAITTLRDYVKSRDAEAKRRNIETPKDEKYSDIYFNIACYHALLAQSLNGVAADCEINRIKSEVFEALSISVEVWPSNKEYAKKDPDFEFVRDSEEFIKIVS